MCQVYQSGILPILYKFTLLFVNMEDEEEIRALP